uniref:Uncharacterized protein n=1 Tax=Anopheles atroparvus TaxID=41427 RepID=A0A182IL50_ANOAO
MEDAMRTLAPAKLSSTSTPFAIICRLNRQANDLDVCQKTDGATARLTNSALGTVAQADPALNCRSTGDPNSFASRAGKPVSCIGRKVRLPGAAPIRNAGLISIPCSSLIMNSSSSTLGMLSMLSRLSLLKLSPPPAAIDSRLFLRLTAVEDFAPATVGPLGGLISMIFELVVTGVEGMMSWGRLTGLRMWMSLSLAAGGFFTVAVGATLVDGGVVGRFEGAGFVVVDGTEFQPRVDVFGVPMPWRRLLLLVMLTVMVSVVSISLSGGRAVEVAVELAYVGDEVIKDSTTSRSLCVTMKSRSGRGS